MTIGDLNQPLLWNAFFEGSGAHGSYSSYAHPKYPERIETPFLKESVIDKLIPTRYPDISLVRAPLNLLKAACKDPENQRFVLLSESCIPLYSFDRIYEFLAQEDKSFIRSELVPLPSTKLAWQMLKVPGFVPLNCFFKQHTWMILNRRAAEMLIENDFTDVYDWSIGRRTFSADEHYFVQVLWKLGYPGAELINRQTTFADWHNAEYREMPLEGFPGEIQRSLRPKTFETLTPEDCQLARDLGCLFMRKVSRCCSTDEILSNKPISSKLNEMEVRRHPALMEFFVRLRRQGEPPRHLQPR